MGKGSNLVIENASKNKKTTITKLQLRIEKGELRIRTVNGSEIMAY